MIKVRFANQGSAVYVSMDRDYAREDWKSRLESQGFRVSDKAEQILRDLTPVSSDVAPLRFVLIRGDMFSDENRTTQNIQSEAEKLKCTELAAEAACHIHEKLSQTWMAFLGFEAIVVMIRPVADDQKNLRVLGSLQDDDGMYLGACVNNGSDEHWCSGLGFAYALA